MLAISRIGCHVYVLVVVVATTDNLQETKKILKEDAEENSEGPRENSKQERTGTPVTTQTHIKANMKAKAKAKANGNGNGNATSRR